MKRTCWLWYETDFKKLHFADYLSLHQVWEDASSFHGDLKKLSREVIWTSYKFLPTKAQAANFWSPQHHFNYIKQEIMELLMDGEFLHDGVDDNVMCPSIGWSLDLANACTCRITLTTWCILLSQSCASSFSMELLINWGGYSLRNSRKYPKWWSSLLQRL